jgi:hypothetical protein
MAFITPQYEYVQVKQAIAQQYPPEHREEVYSIIEPFMVDGSRVPLCILQLAQGRKDDVLHYAQCAQKDFRDVIFSAEYPNEAALNTPGKIEDFQRTLEWLGLPRELTLDQAKRQMSKANPGQECHTDKREGDKIH